MTPKSDTGTDSVSIVIPHLHGLEMICECLAAVSRTAPAAEIIVVDNASGEAAKIQARFPAAHMLLRPRNEGFARACNLGAREAAGNLLCFLNDDTICEQGWLELLVARIQSDARIASVQPALRSAVQPERFDYAGAAGGQLDLFGIPFARGRIFDVLEDDLGQYPPAPVFWASGACMLIRRAAFFDAGAFDEQFFAHMEEIDLCWRLRLRRWQVWAEPRAVVYHRGAATLAAGSLRKHWLNHRNSLLMVACNWGRWPAVRLLPLRLVLELAMVPASLARGDLRRAVGIAGALGWLLLHPGEVSRRRRRIQKMRLVADAEVRSAMYPGSILISHYLRGLQRFMDL